jgi:polyprenyl P-hydroxybenzoate/phenylacrylic acid decarboxylase-like protein
MTHHPGRRFVLGISGASGAAYALRTLEQLLLSGHEVHLVVSDYGRRLLADEAAVRRIDAASLLPHLAPTSPQAENEPLAVSAGQTPQSHSASDEHAQKIEPGDSPGNAQHPRINARPPLTGLPLTPPTSYNAARDFESLSKRLICHPNKDVGAVIASGSFLHDGMIVVPCSSTSLGAIATGSGSNLLSRAAMVTLKERRPLIICHRESPLNLIDIENMRTLALAGAINCPTNPGLYLRPQSVQEIIDFIAGKILDLLHVPHELKTRWEDAAY